MKSLSSWQDTDDHDSLYANQIILTVYRGKDILLILTKLTKGKMSDMFIRMLAKPHNKIPGAFIVCRKALIYCLVVCFGVLSGTAILILSFLDHVLSLLIKLTRLSRLFMELFLLILPVLSFLVIELSRLPFWSFFPELLLPWRPFDPLLLEPLLDSCDKLLSFRWSPSSPSLGSWVVGANVTLSFLVTGAVPVWQFWLIFSLLSADSSMVDNCVLRRTGSPSWKFPLTGIYPLVCDLNTLSSTVLISSSL